LRGVPLAARRAGPARSGKLALRWLDTASGTLAAEGLALEATGRGPARLVRVLPAPGATWLPGTPPEMLPGDGRAEAAGGKLHPVATLAGSLTRLALRDGVEALLLRGRLGAGTAEAPVARLVLAGPAPAVLETMQALAAAMPAAPPRLSLAEAGRALATGEPGRPRRLGAPRLDPDLDVEAALVLALGHLAEVMLWHAPAAQAGTTPEGVHQMRVALRRLRSLLRVFRPACDGPSLRRFDGGLKELAGLLGPARDWDVWLGGLGAEIAEALPDEPRIAALLHAARGRREAAYAALRPVLAGTLPGQLAWEAVALATTRPWREEAPEDAAAERRAVPLARFAETVLDRRWRRIAEAGETIADLPDAEFHELRIEAKRMRYAAELFAPLWGRKRGRRFLGSLAEVQDAFGLANDAVVARALLRGLAGQRGRLAWAGGLAEGWALARARRARRRASRAWMALVDTETFWNQR
jgi:CHAD domain-containing protein